MSDLDLLLTYLLDVLVVSTETHSNQFQVLSQLDQLSLSSFHLFLLLLAFIRYLILLYLDSLNMVLQSHIIQL